MTVRDRAGHEIEIPGAVLNAQFACTPGLLILTTEDTPYEEALHFVLVSDEAQQLDWVELSNRMTPGTLSGLRVETSESLLFAFFGGDLWRLTVLAEPVRRLIPAAGVHYRGGSLLGKHHLDLKRVS